MRPQLPRRQKKRKRPPNKDKPIYSIHKEAIADLPLMKPGPTRDQVAHFVHKVKIKQALTKRGNIWAAVLYGFMYGLPLLVILIPGRETWIKVAGDLMEQYSHIHPIWVVVATTLVIAAPMVVLLYLIVFPNLKPLDRALRELYEGDDLGTTLLLLERILGQPNLFFQSEKQGGKRALPLFVKHYDQIMSIDSPTLGPAVRTAMTDLAIYCRGLKPNHWGYQGMRYIQARIMAADLPIKTGFNWATMSRRIPKKAKDEFSHWLIQKSRQQQSIE